MPTLEETGGGMADSSSVTDVGERPDYDPVFLNSRREAWIIFCVWAVCFLWTVPFCYFTGFGEVTPGQPVSTVLGIPNWLFWGVILPWLLADVFTIWFAAKVMKDDDLGGPESSTQAQVAENGGQA